MRVYGTIRIISTWWLKKGFCIMAADRERVFYFFFLHLIIKPVPSIGPFRSARACAPAAVVAAVVGVLPRLSSSLITSRHVLRRISIRTPRAQNH